MIQENWTFLSLIEKLMEIYHILKWPKCFCSVQKKLMVTDLLIEWKQISVKIQTSSEIAQEQQQQQMSALERLIK